MIQQKTNQLTKSFFIASFLLMGTFAKAQQNKIDGVAVVIGKNIVLESDIQKFKKEVETRSEGKMKISDCEMLEQLMQQKLLAHHAVIDSVSVTQDQVNSRVNRSIAFFKRQYNNSEDKMVKAYGFDNLQDMKNELSKVQKENALIEEEQRNITSKIDVTPEEVRVYFKSLKETKSLPEIPEEVELGQIVFKAKPKQEEIQKVIKKLEKIKKDVEDGASFRLKAIIHSIGGSAQKGGDLGFITKKSDFIREFKEVAFSLSEGEISEPFKTDFGYHIVLLKKIRGEAREVAHIILRPEISDEEVNRVKEKAEKVKKEIVDGVITFKEAVKKYSDDEDTKNNGGLIVNPYTGESVFEPARMNDPALYARIDGLKKGELSDVFYDETREGDRMYKIMRMIDKRESHQADILIDYVKIKELALARKKEETLKKWSAKKITETYIKLHENYKKCTFKQNWRKEIKK